MKKNRSGTMKKWLFVIAIFFVFPISVIARTATKEDLIETIDSFQNIQVDDNIKILSMEVLKDKIEVTLLENNLPEIRYIPYKIEKNTFTFQGGIVKEGVLENNQYAFYLYSILENFPKLLNLYYIFFLLLIFVDQFLFHLL